MIVISTCSFTVNGPGLSDTPKILTSGTMRAQSRPIGKAISWATSYKNNAMKISSLEIMKMLRMIGLT